MGAPTTVGKLRDTESIKYMRVIDADTGEIVQLEIIDTGTTTVDGLKIYRQYVTTATGPEDKPNGETSGDLTMSGSSQPIPVTADARGVLLKADSNNSNDILLFGIVPLEPGESVFIPTGDDASWIDVTGTNPDVLHYAVLTYT